jgi:hypothetical protein
MTHSFCCLVLVAWTGGSTWAAAPPCDPQTPLKSVAPGGSVNVIGPSLTLQLIGPAVRNVQVRFLSLSQAISLALETDGHASLHIPQHEFQECITPLCAKNRRQPDPETHPQDVNQLLLNVEVAYWNLYGAYWTLVSREEGIHLAIKTLKRTRIRFEGGRAINADLAQARGQCKLFWDQRTEALDKVKEAEGQLRALVGLPQKDGDLLVPGDAPVVRDVEPDWNDALDEVLKNREEIKLAGEELKTAQEKLQAAKRLQAILDWLPGVAPIRAVVEEFLPEPEELKAQGRSWGPPDPPVKMSGPVRWATVNAARAHLAMRGVEYRIVRSLAFNYRQLYTSAENLQTQQSQREACASQLRARQREFRTGRSRLDDLLEAQRLWVDAVANEHAAIASYNNAQAGFAFARGTILQRHKAGLTGK